MSWFLKAEMFELYHLFYDSRIAVCATHTIALEMSVGQFVHESPQQNNVHQQYSKINPQ